MVLGLLLLVVHSSFCLQSTDNDGQIWLRLKVTPLRRSLLAFGSKENLSTINILPVVEQEQDAEDVETKRRSTENKS